MLEFKKYAIHAANCNLFARIIERNKKYTVKVSRDPNYFKNVAVG